MKKTRIYLLLLLVFYPTLVLSSTSLELDKDFLLSVNNEKCIVSLIENEIYIKSDSLVSNYLVFDRVINKFAINDYSTSCKVQRVEDDLVITNSNNLYLRVTAKEFGQVLIFKDGLIDFLIKSDILYVGDQYVGVILNNLNTNLVSNTEVDPLNTPENFEIGGIRLQANFKKDVYGFLNNNFPVIKKDTYWVPANSLGFPNNTISELQELRGKPELARATIDNLYELYEFVFSSGITSGHNFIVREYGSLWSFIKPGYSVLSDFSDMNCASASNMAIYLLDDNYDETGCVWRHTSYSANRVGGHCTSYIKYKGKYWFYDISTGGGYLDENDGHSGDLCDIIINSEPENYMIFWHQIANDDYAIFAMFPGYNEALGVSYSTEKFYYPRSTDVSGYIIWYDELDTIRWERGIGDPTPPKNVLGVSDFSDFKPYSRYKSDSFNHNSVPVIHYLPTDNR